MASSNYADTLTVVSASNLNPRYLECIPAFIDFWMAFEYSSNLRVIPHVFLIADDIPESLIRYQEFISVLNVTDLDSGFVAQNIRALAAGTFQTDFVMTTDIDMLPLSFKVTKKAISELTSNPDAFVVARDVLDAGQFAICYGLARPEVWAKITLNRRPEDFESQLRHLFSNRFLNAAYSGVRGGDGWFTDQEYLYEQVMAASGLDVVKLRDPETGHRRLDRAHHPKWLTWLMLPLILFGLFTDYHVHLPISKSQKLTTSIRLLVVFRERFLWLSR